MSSWWTKFPLKTSHALLNWLLIFVPVALVAGFVWKPSPLIIFAIAALGIIPLAGVLGEATEDLASYLGQGLGGLLNATMGNATEFIIAIFALRAGHVEVVKASLSGSIIGNILLVLGLSVLVGGWGRDRQTFSRQAAAVNSTMMFIAVVALVIPAVFAWSVFGQLREHDKLIENMSLLTSGVLIVVYLLSLFFSFGTHATKEQETHKSQRSIGSALPRAWAGDGADRDSERGARSSNRRHEAGSGFVGTVPGRDRDCHHRQRGRARGGDFLGAAKTKWT